MAEGPEPKTSFAPSSGRPQFLDPETFATWKAKRRVRSQRLKSVTDFYGEPEARNRSNGAVRRAGNRALRAEDHPQAGRVRHLQGSLSGGVNDDPMVQASWALTGVFGRLDEARELWTSGHSPSACRSRAGQDVRPPPPKAMLRAAAGAWSQPSRYRGQCPIGPARATRGQARSLAAAPVGSPPTGSPETPAGSRAGSATQSSARPKRIGVHHTQRASVPRTHLHRQPRRADP